MLDHGTTAARTLEQTTPTYLGAGFVFPFWARAAAGVAHETAGVVVRRSHHGSFKMRAVDRSRRIAQQVYARAPRPRRKLPML